MKKLENKEIFQNGNSKNSFFSISVSKHFRSYAQLAIAHSSLILTQIGRIDSEISRGKKTGTSCVLYIPYEYVRAFTLQKPFIKTSFSEIKLK